MSAPTETPRKARGERPPRDMLLSLAVLLVPIALIFGLWQFIGSDRPVSVVDAVPTFQEASDAGLDVSAPVGLSEDWRTVSSAVNRQDGAVTLRVGYYSPTGAGVQLVVSDGDRVELLELVLRTDPTLTGITETSAREWETYRTADENNALVWESDGQVSIVYGDAPVEELRELADALD